MGPTWGPRTYMTENYRLFYLKKILLNYIIVIKK